MHSSHLASLEERSALSGEPVVLFTPAELSGPIMQSSTLNCSPDYCNVQSIG